MKNQFRLNDFLKSENNTQGIYIYGAGDFGHLIKEIIFSGEMKYRFGGFIDRNAKVLSKIHSDEKIVTVDQIDEDMISVLICIRMENDYVKTEEEIKEILATNKKRGYVFDINREIRIEFGLAQLNGHKWVIDNFAYLRHYFGKNKKENKKFNDLLDEYTKLIHPVYDGSYHLADCQSVYFNIFNGMRLTTGEIAAKKKIHFFGDSRVLSVFTDDDSTICSHLQKIYDEYGIINHGMQFRNYVRIFYQIDNEDINKNDIVIIGTNWCIYDKTDIMCAFSELVRLKQRANEIGFYVYFLNLPSIIEINGKFLTSYEKNIESYYTNLIDSKNYYSNNLLMRQALQIIGIKEIDATLALNEIHKEDYFVDNVHYTSCGNMRIARFIKEYFELEKSFNEVVGDRDVIARHKKNNENFLKEISNAKFEDEIERYQNEIRNQAFKVSYEDKETVGAIVMNCNPFTKGHLFLVEEALKCVDKLYVFVLEEDSSYFSFVDRFNMVKLNLQKFDNVRVLNSGKFIISKFSFPEYFEKDVKKDAIIDASKDISIFAKYIAPTLGITKRFVGEEPIDIVTNQYNNQLKNYLFKEGIEVVEIARKEFRGQVISASRVRSFINNGEFEQIEDLVPKESFEYLKKICNRQKVYVDKMKHNTDAKGSI